MNLPNKLTVVRLIFVPLFILVFMFPYSLYDIKVIEFTLLSTNLSILDIILFVIFFVAAFTDFLDGYLARKNNLITTFGKFMDPIADKLIVNTILLLLASSGKISILVPILMISRDTIVDGIRLVASQKQVVLAASMLGKAKTVTQMIAIGLLLLNNLIFGYFHIPMDQIMIIVATIISIISGIDYFVKNKEYILESI